MGDAEYDSSNPKCSLDSREVPKNTGYLLQFMDREAQAYENHYFCKKYCLVIWLSQQERLK